MAAVAVCERLILQGFSTPLNPDTQGKQCARYSDHEHDTAECCAQFAGDVGFKGQEDSKKQPGDRQVEPCLMDSRNRDLVDRNGSSQR